MLETPAKIRELQRKLYLKAKQEKKLRFYSLYDKVFRADILSHSYKLARANKGAPGIDGVSFEDIERSEGGVERYLTGIAMELKDKTYKPMPIRRTYIPKPNGGKRPLGIPTIKDRVVQTATKIVIEPIFEADFCDSSYGFRPKKDAHQAMDEISLQLRRRKTHVIDADISKFFDNISHDKLLKLVAKRILDKNILRLIKLWLKAPVIEEGEDGKKRHMGSKKGTPQGSVVSPLLANIYLNVLDSTWEFRRVKERFKAVLVRYADDIVVLCKGNTERVLKGLRSVLSYLGLMLNEDKTKVIDARKESFDFLGFTIEVKKNPKTGKEFPLIRPSKKSVRHIKGEIKTLTSRRNFWMPKAIAVRKFNEVVRGWVNYFYYGHCSKTLSNLKCYFEEKVRTFLRRKRHLKGRSYGYKFYPYSFMYDILRLYKIPTTAPWTKTAKAYGRR